MTLDMRAYPWQEDVARAAKLRHGEAWRRFGRWATGMLAGAACCVAIGVSVGSHFPPPLPDYAPAPGVFAVSGPHPDPTHYPHPHVRGYLIYRTARWAFRRGW